MNMSKPSIEQEQECLELFIFGGSGDLSFRKLLPARIRCVAMEGLNEEGQEQIDEIEMGPLLNTALIAAAQKVEHYEIAAYGSLIALAKQLGETGSVKLLADTLEEEKATDQKLSLIAEEKLAAEALGQ
jgi:ferritin-like metal-binding protein YciE